MRNLFMLLFLVGMISCDKDLPPVENEEEVITDVVLTFEPAAGTQATTVTATASDPDGEGPEPIGIVSDITLLNNTTYNLTVSFKNGTTDLTSEIQTEGAEHMIFYGFSTDIFTSPLGDGNIDNREDAVNYSDQDINGEPIGLATSWTSGAANTGATFKLVLKHQPSLKSSTSTVNDGSTDMDLTWPLTIN